MGYVFISEIVIIISLFSDESPPGQIWPGTSETSKPGTLDMDL